MPVFSGESDDADSAVVEDRSMRLGSKVEKSQKTG